MKKAIAFLIVVFLLTTMAYGWATLICKYRGVNLTIGTPEGIMVKEGTNGTGGISVTSTISKTLVPCQSSGNGKFFTEDMESSSSYAKAELYFKASGKAYTSIQPTSITITGDGKDNDLNPALRVGIHNGTTYKVYAVSNNYTSTYNVYNGVDLVEVKPTKTFDSFSYSIPNGSYSTTPLNVYFWLEGNDDSCTTDNLISAKAVSLAIEFTCS